MAAGAMTQLAASNGDLDTSEQVQMVGAYGKVFIANGSNLKVADFQSTKITTADVGSHAPDRGNELTGGTSGAKMIVDYITTTSGACAIYGYRTTSDTFSSGETVTGTDDDSNAISFATNAAETAPPHWYDWTVYGGDTTTYGTMPNKAYLVTISGGRLILSGNPEYPHQAPASRSGNPWDFNINATDARRATVIGNGDAGEFGDVVRALIPIRDGQLVLGCASSIYVVIDNPAFGGRVVEASTTVGIFDGTSWCLDGEGNVYFWGTGGLYKMDRSSLTVDNLSRASLPDLVEDEAADPSTHRITMGYDPVRVGVKVSITLLADGTNSNYWYDLNVVDEAGRGTFFPDSFSSDHGAYSMYYYDSNTVANKGLLIGCKDGYMRVHDDDAANDDGTAVDSYVKFGPLSLGDGTTAGSIIALDLVLSGGASGGSASDSDDATVTVWAEDVAEEIVEKLAADTSPKLSLTFTGPGRRRGSKKRRGVRGGYAGIKIGNDTAGETWGFEKLIIDGGAPGRRLQ